MSPQPQSRFRRISRYAIAALFVGAGIAHFTHEAFFLRIVPPVLPNPRLLVQVSGLAEIAGGIGVLVPALRRAAGLGLIALLVAVFPANLYMALEPERFADIASRAGLYLRLPLQFLGMFWVRWVTASRSAPS
jgi:uncharacterized membrane protein